MRTEAEKNQRIETIIRYSTGVISLKEAMSELRLGKRQIIRLTGRYRSEGLSYFQLGELRGRPVSREADKKKAVEKLREDNFNGFAPSFASEILSEQHGINFSKETIRQIMIKDGLWTPKVNKAVKQHLTRERRGKLGELLQIDGSHHAWFEGRGEKCCLIVMIDDATSQIMELRFAKTETTFAYMESLYNTIKNNGIPRYIYSDKHSVFRKERPNQQNDPYAEPTQFHRACQELGIDLINANSPQAKGRVERCNRTLQDRLVKILRLQGISTIEEANNFMPEFIKIHNLKYAKAPRDTENGHIQNTKSDDELHLILSKQNERTLQKNNMISFDGIKYQLDDNFKNRLSKQKVILFQCFNGQSFIKWGNYLIKHHIIEVISEQQPNIIKSKNINDFIDKNNVAA